MVNILKARQLLRAGKFADAHVLCMELKKEILDPSSEEDLSENDQIKVYTYFEFILVLKKVLYK